MRIAHHISDEGLDRYHQGDVPEPELTSVEEHLLSCRECIDRAEEKLRRIRRSGHEHLCHVSTEDLELYHLGYLNVREALSIRKHTLECQECADRLLAIEQFIKLIRAGIIRLDSLPFPVSIPKSRKPPAL